MTRLVSNKPVDILLRDLENNPEKYAAKYPLARVEDYRVKGPDDYTYDRLVRNKVFIKNRKTGRVYFEGDGDPLTQKQKTFLDRERIIQKHYREIQSAKGVWMIDIDTGVIGECTSYTIRTSSGMFSLNVDNNDWEVIDQIIDFCYHESREGRYLQFPVWFIPEKVCQNKSFSEAVDECLYEVPFGYRELCIFRSPPKRLNDYSCDDEEFAEQAWKQDIYIWLSHLIKNDTMDLLARYTFQGPLDNPPRGEKGELEESDED